MIGVKEGLIGEEGEAIRNMVIEVMLNKEEEIEDEREGEEVMEEAEEVDIQTMTKKKKPTK